MAERVERRLAAIMAADIVGYSRLVEADEASTLTAIRTLRRDVIDPLLAEHHGRIVKLMGDGAIVEFGSVVDAVACAVAVQKGVPAGQPGVGPEHRIQFRIGINLGDVVVEDGDLLGDGVNVAARLEALAGPGGILMSGTVRDHLQGKLSLPVEDIGEHSLKNIARPVRVYRVGPAGAHDFGGSHVLPPSPAKASIAVLPFTNMSSDPDQEHFGDGLAEDLITDLSKVPGLVVIARNSTFAYKGRSVDIRTIARDLGVRYVIEGSVRRSEARVRINAQLIDATDNSHVWADRFDRDLQDVFALQDDVVSRVVNALAGVLSTAPFPGKRRARNLEAYDLFVRGRLLAMQSPTANRAARPLLERSIELDREFAEAHAWLAMSHVSAWTHAGEPKDLHAPLARAAAEKAIACDPTDATGHAVLAYALIFESEFDRAAAELATALRINPNHADAWAFSGELKMVEGNAAEGIEDLRKALRLNPHAPGFYYWILGLCQYAAGRYDDAVETLRHEATHKAGSRRILAAALAQLGRNEEAREEARQFMATHPNFSAQEWAKTQAFRRESDRQHFVDGYVKAGLPA